MVSAVLQRNRGGCRCQRSKSRVLASEQQGELSVVIAEHFFACRDVASSSGSIEMGTVDPLNVRSRVSAIVAKGGQVQIDAKVERLCGLVVAVGPEDNVAGHFDGKDGKEASEIFNVVEFG